MSLPPLLTGRLALPVIAAPLFIISNPALVIAQSRAGVVGSFPSLNARPAEQLDEWLAEIEKALAGTERGTVRGQPDRASLQRPAGARPRRVCRASGADRHHLARRAAGGERGDPFLRRHRAARRDQRPVCAKGGREGRRRADRGCGRRRRARGCDFAVRADRRNPRLVRRVAGALRRDRDRGGGAGGRGDGGGSGLCRLGLHRDRGGARRSRAQAGDRGRTGGGHRVHEPDHRGSRQLSARQPDRGGSRSGQSGELGRLGDELRGRGRVEEAVEGHLGVGTGDRRRRGRGAGGGAGGAAAARVRRRRGRGSPLRRQAERLYPISTRFSVLPAPASHDARSSN